MLAFGLGWGEIVVIMLVILLLFGAKKLPELAKGLGKGIREFKKASSEISDELHRASYEEEEEPRPRSRRERPIEEKPAKEESGEGKKKPEPAESSPESKA
jgi:sec-independent protein translocase protein TatA